MICYISYKKTNIIEDYTTYNKLNRKKGVICDIPVGVRTVFRVWKEIPLGQAYITYEYNKLNHSLKMLLSYNIVIDIISKFRSEAIQLLLSLWYYLVQYSHRSLWYVSYGGKMSDIFFFRSCDRRTIFRLSSKKSYVRHHHRSISIRFYGDRLTLDTRYLTFFDHGIFGKGFAARPKEQAFDANHTNPVAA